MDRSLSVNSGARAGAGISKLVPGRKFLQRVGYGALGLGAALFVGHLVWTGSGSNQWELAADKDGVKVWTLKSPGTARLRVKAHAVIKSSLGGMVKLLEDLDSCADAYCYDTKLIRNVESVPGQNARYVRFKFDVPIPGFATRDYVLFSEHVQDPKSKKLELNIMAAPDALPRDACCIRVTHLHNNWKLTPLATKELDIEFTQDTDLGGMHYVLANIALKEGMYKVMREMQDFMNKPRYRNARVDSIQELEAD